MDARNDGRTAESGSGAGVTAEAWLTLDEAARYLRVSKGTLYRLCAGGRLPFYKLAVVGGRRFRRADLDALLTPGGPATRR